MKIKQHSVKIMALTLISAAGLAGGVVNIDTTPIPVKVKAVSINSPLSREEYRGHEILTVNSSSINNRDISKLHKFSFAFEGSDNLGRNGYAIANLSKKNTKDPNTPRRSISAIRPVGWLTGVSVVKDNGKIVPLYNRCHLIGYALDTLTATNINNFITGTEYFNQKYGMESYENRLLNYLKDHPNQHVYYKVTPIYRSNELLARGVEMQAYAPNNRRDRNANFNIYVFNQEPGVKLNYKKGGVPLAGNYHLSASARNNRVITPDKYESELATVKLNKDPAGYLDELFSKMQKADKQLKHINVNSSNTDNNHRINNRRNNHSVSKNDTIHNKSNLSTTPSSESNHRNAPSDISAYVHRNADVPSSDHKSAPTHNIPATGRQQSHVSELISAAGISLAGIIAILFTGFKIRHKKDNQIR